MVNLHLLQRCYPGVLQLFLKLFRALVDSSISVESEPDDDPWDARDGDGDQSDKDEPSENSSALLPKKTHSLAL